MSSISIELSPIYFLSGLIALCVGLVLLFNSAALGFIIYGCIFIALGFIIYGCIFIALGIKTNV